MAVLPNEGFNVVGHLDSLLGMGQAARNLIEVLQENDVPHHAINVRLTESVLGPEMQTNSDIKYQNTIWAINPERLKQAQRHLPDVVAETTRSVGYWWWELSQVPPIFQEMSTRVDEIWAPSSFIAETLSHELDTPVFKVPLTAPDVQPPNTSDINEIKLEFKIDPSEFVVITTADLLSSIDRKNIQGTIQAFTKAFSARDKAILVVKLLNTQARPLARELIAAWAQSNPNVRIVDQSLTRQEMLALISSSDVLLSLHRSEGLGLHLMEAMAVGTPVVTSNYSGNLDFCTRDNCILVEGEVIPAHDASGQYLNLPDASWFEPNVGQAADALRQLYRDDAYRAKIAKEATNAYRKLRDSGDFSGFVVDRLKNWASTRARADISHSSKSSPVTPESLTIPEFGVNLVGYLQAEFGMGEYSRRLLNVLKAAQVPTRCEILQSRGIRSTEVLSEQLSTAHKDSLPFAVNLVALNANDIREWANNEGSALIRDRYTIGVWAWELETFPQNLHEAFNYVDEIWAISKFSAAAISEFAPVPVSAIPPLVKETRSVALTEQTSIRSDLGIDEKAFLVTYTFDYYGTLERKNPAGAIQSYIQAFGPNDGAVLVLKSTNEASNPLGQKALHDLAAQRPDIFFVEGYWSREKVRALIAASDVYLSLHRSEGLGLGIAEALVDGVSVIATDYGGHLDFATRENSQLVDYRLQPVGEGAEPYPSTAWWANPDLEAAAQKLRNLFDKRQAQPVRSSTSRLDPDLESAAETFVSERLKEIFTELPAYTPQLAVLSPTEGTTEPEGDQKNPVWWQVNPTAWFYIQDLVKDLDMSELTTVIQMTNTPVERQADVTVSLAGSKVRLKLRKANEKIEVSFPLKSVTETDEVRIEVTGEPWQPSGDPRTLYLLIGPTLVKKSETQSRQAGYRRVKQSSSASTRIKNAVRQILSR